MQFAMPGSFLLYHAPAQFILLGIKMHRLRRGGLHCKAKNSSKRQQCCRHNARYFLHWYILHDCSITTLTTSILNVYPSVIALTSSLCNWSIWGNNDYHAGLWPNCNIVMFNKPSSFVLLTQPEYAHKVPTILYGKIFINCARVQSYRSAVKWRLDLPS